MQVSNNDLVKASREYAIWDLIDHHNKEAIENNDKSQIIHTTMARQLRLNLDNFLARYKRNISQLTAEQFMNSVNMVYAQAFGNKPPYTHDNGNNLFNLQRADFSNMINWPAAKRFSNGQGYELAGKNQFWPISPYDPSYANFGTVLDNGSHLGGIALNRQINSAGLTNMNTLMNTPFVEDLHQDDDHNWHGRYTQKPVYSMEDVCGLSQLKRWMTQKEYTEIKDHVLQAVDSQHLTQQDVNTYQSMTNKAVYLMRNLRSEGYTYKINKDPILGQASATIDNTNVKVRVMDTPNNADYIGHVFDQGVNGYYSATIKNPKTGTYTVDSTPQQALDLVNFALGRRVLVRNAQGQPTKFAVGSVWQGQRMFHGQNVSYNGTYHSKGDLTAISSPYVVNGQQDRYGNVIRMNFKHGNRKNSTTVMRDEKASDDYLRESISTARENFANRIGLDSLLQAAKNHAGESDYTPNFDNDPLISNIQENVWDAVYNKQTGKQTIILKPGISKSDLIDFEDKHVKNDGTLDKYGQTHLSDYQYNTDEPLENNIHQFITDSIDYHIGSFEPDQDGKRFDPNAVSRYQTSTYGLYRNEEDMVKALRLSNVDSKTLKGNQDSLNVIADKLVKFDPNDTMKLKDSKNPFVHSVYMAVGKSLYDNGVTFSADDLVIDKNGIIQYKGSIKTREKNEAGKQSDKAITGYIGQVFVPKSKGLKKGVIYTKYASGNNHALIPGYNATILPQKDGENKSMEERTVLTGYKQQLIKNIHYQIRKDLMMADSQTVSDDSTGLNQTYKQIYGDRREKDFVEKYQEQKMPDHVLQAIIRSESEKVRYSNDIQAGSTVHADYTASKYGYDIANDNSLDPYNLTGNRYMSLLTPESDGCYDPIASNATTVNQGIVRFLASGADVDDNGHIIPGPKEGLGSRTDLMNLPEAKYMKYNPFDRQNMTLSNWLQAQLVTPPVHVAQMTFKGWNQDDGIVVSKEFADKYQVRDPKTGEMRPQRKGDKALDPNGNKGVITLVVDPNMDPKKAKEQGLEDEVKFFKDNPKLEVVMAPFPAVSRYNGGTARQLMQDPEDLVGLDGKTIKGAMGKMPMIITDKLADEKTHIYSKEDIQAGKGRKVSAQLAWALSAKGADKIFKEAYGPNGSALNNLTEYLNTMGLDMNQYGNFEVGLDKETMNNRNVIKQPDIIYTATGRVNYKQTEKDLAGQLNHQGGLMELPFSIKLASGQETNVLPVMSSYLRSNSELVDGSVITHDYTHAYENIYRDGITYRASQKTVEELGQKQNLTSAETRKLNKAQNNVDTIQKSAQESYNHIANDLKQRVFSGKHNIFKDKVMAHRMPNSATSIWTADPRLKIDQIGMSPNMAKKMGFEDGETAVLWRDPILRDGGMRAATIKIDPTLTGVSISPSMDKSYDGDFDGDSVGLIKLHSQEAVNQAKRVFGVKNNLLDYGAKDEKTGKYPLYMQHSLDIMVAEHKHPALNKQWNEITDRVNKFENDYHDAQKQLKKDFKAGEIDQTKFDRQNKALDTQVDIDRTHAVNNLNDYYQSCYKDDMGANIRYTDIQDHLKSVKEACIDTGAKGSLNKFLDYTKWLGASMMDGTNVHVDKKGNLQFDKIKDYGNTRATREMQIATMKATAIKSFGTGIAGAFSQRGIKALRNVNPKAILELTYPVTQSVLQVKHDPKEAVKKYDMLMGPAKNLWRGYSMSQAKDGSWSINRDETGKPLISDKKEWIQTFHNMYSNDLNVSPNMDYVKEVADALSDPKTGKMFNVEQAPTISLMDKLAYNGTFNNVLDAAKKKQNLFRGKNNAQFAPNKLKANVERKHEEIKAREDYKKERNLDKYAQVFIPTEKVNHKFGKTDTINGNSSQHHYADSVLRRSYDQPVGQAEQALKDEENEIDKPVQKTTHFAEIDNNDEDTVEQKGEAAHLKI